MTNDLKTRTAEQVNRTDEQLDIWTIEHVNKRRLNLCSQNTSKTSWNSYKHAENAEISHYLTKYFSLSISQLNISPPLCLHFKPSFSLFRVPYVKTAQPSHDPIHKTSNQFRRQRRRHFINQKNEITLRRRKIQEKTVPKKKKSEMKETIK